MLILVRKRNIPTERPPGPANLVLTFADRGVAWLVQRVLTVVNLSFLDQSREFFVQVSSQLYSQWLSGPPSRPTAFQKIC
jgi:hypothetical protein